MGNRANRFYRGAAGGARLGGAPGRGASPQERAAATISAATRPIATEIATIGPRRSVVGRRSRRRGWANVPNAPGATPTWGGTGIGATTFPGGGGGAAATSGRSLRDGRAEIISRLGGRAETSSSPG